MIKKYQAPKVVEVLNATTAIQGKKNGPAGDGTTGLPHQPMTTSAGYPADE
jgi:hypothetical protein